VSWIYEVDPDEREGRLARTCDNAHDPELGRPANVLTVHSVKPTILDAHLALYRRVVKCSDVVPQSEREAIATLVSAKNDCLYCAVHHRVALVRASEREQLDVDARAVGNAMVAHGRRGEPLPELVSPRLRAMAAYAVPLTANPGEASEQMVVSLRDAGLSDTEIFEINQVIAYFNYVNRIVTGLGVELEPEYAEQWADIPWDAP
jgi:uncharacterized peroxidase-related enzyme